MSSEENREPEEPADTSSDAEDVDRSKSNSPVRRGSKDKQGDKDNGTKSTLDEKLSNKMFIYARETICFFLAVAFTALAALHSSPPRISKPPLAKPFFNESSLVLDFYKGHLSALVNRVTDSDFSFVMYYAPWDADCQAMKEEFESVAQYYHSQVFFAAINCWHPGSECRARYSKIQSYPVLMLYPLRESGVQYKGIRSAPYMIRFIHTFMNPITRITNSEHLMEHLKTHDAVMIGYFNFTGLPRSPGYKEFYRTALRRLERDPNGEIAFVAITSSTTAAEFGVSHFPAANLVMWNETLFYSQNAEWSADNLLVWMYNIVHRVVTWLQPPGSKSLTFAPYFWDGPVLFLFTPRNPLHFENDNYNLLKEVGLQYYDCSGSPQILNIIYRLRKSRLEAAVRAFEKRQFCMSILEAEQLQRNSIFGSESRRHWANTTVNCCSETPTNQCVHCTSRPADGPEDPVCPAQSAASCRRADLFGMAYAFDEYGRPAYLHSSADNLDDHCFTDRCDTSGAGGQSVDADRVVDPLSATEVRKAFLKDDCRRFLTGYSYQRRIFPHDADEEVEPPIGLAESICKVNKTLALVAIDSLTYFHFAEGLGIDLASFSDRTAVVILDPADESQYVMQQEFSRNSLVQFINNYTDGYLRRTMRSNNPKRFVRSSASNECSEKSDSRICVPELTTDNFLSTVLNPDKDVVVMYHSPYCAFCSAVAYVYLTVAHYLIKMDHLEFVRIDGDNNDLPWEYTMNRYPSILFFPAGRKEESTLFPWTLPVSVGNMLNFVLANLDGEEHLEALINVCGAGAAGPDCRRRARWLCLDVLGERLRELRRLRRVLGDRGLDQRRRRLLLRLRHIREVHLLLGTGEDLSVDSAKVQLLRKKFKRFYRRLEKLRVDRNKRTGQTEQSERELLKERKL